MTAPDRIWIDAWGGNWSPVAGGTQGVEYVRAALVNPAEAEVKRLREALSIAKYMAARNLTAADVARDLKRLIDREPTKLAMGQVMAECDCETRGICEGAGRCMAEKRETRHE